VFSRKRFATAAAFAFAAAMLAGQTVLADTEVGQTGDHLFTDSSSTPGATCKYATIAPHTYRVSSIKAVAPSVWWPDTDSSNTNQHGPVGWRFAVQKSENMGSTWTTVAHSNYQNKTAYEDQVHPYAAAKAAPFTDMTVTLNTSSYGSGSIVRVVTRALWYKPGGSVLGYVKHPVQYYKAKYGNIIATSSDGYCFTNIGAL
jgi:hypothetical protein